VKPFWEGGTEDFHELEDAAKEELGPAVRDLVVGFKVLLDGHRKQFKIATDKKVEKVSVPLVFCWCFSDVLAGCCRNL
jgi:hypothetical protein